jgi:hypothetical protein
MKKETSFLSDKDNEILELSEEISSKLYPHETVVITFDQVKKTSDDWGLPTKLKD